MQKKQHSPRSAAVGKPRQPLAKAAAPAFATLLRVLLPPAGGRPGGIHAQSAPLAHLDYVDELRLKEQALGQFWKENRLPGRPEPLIASPMARHYRTTSKRKALYKGRTLYLLFGDSALAGQRKPFVASDLEPAVHGRVFSFLQAKLSEPPYALVAAHLNHLIVRGSYAEQAVIFNIDAVSGPLVRKLKQLAEHLRQREATINGVFLYTDPSSSDYYLEARQPIDLLQFKKLFGRDQLEVRHHGRRYHFHPTSFTQVNESMVPLMLEQAKELLSPGPNEALLDLYCGYGLFSHFLAPDYARVLGIDGEGPSIRSAVDNRKLGPGSSNTRFQAHWITDKAIERLQPCAAALLESVILDPPRQGPKPGVIAALGARRPHKALHIFCGVDQIPQSLREWRQGGYAVHRVLVLDMFPGSPNLEVMVLLRQSAIL